MGLFAVAFSFWEHMYKGEIKNDMSALAVFLFFPKIFLM